MLVNFRQILSVLAVGAIGFTPFAAQAGSRCGESSFYGTPQDGYGYVAGRMITANGERFYPSAMTTAHPSLPFGTRLKVTNQGNGKSVVVRVNDRGPYYGGRILDLSTGAFSQIASTSRGVAYVCFSRV
jgi:rare lipoprotein A